MHAPSSRRVSAAGAFFGTKLDLHFVLAMVTVTCSVFLYNDKGAVVADKIEPIPTHAPPSR